MSRRPQVLLVTDVTMPGGVGTHLVQLAGLARSAGWDASVLMDCGTGSDAVAAALTRVGVFVRRGPLYRKHHSADATWAAVFDAFAQERPDVVHVHCGSPRSAILPRECAIEAG